MARTQTIVQLTEELVGELDREAARRGVSRSAIIRDAVVTYLAEQSKAELINAYVDGYQRLPPSDPGAWGRSDREADQQGHELALRLDEEERAAGLSW